MTTQTEALKLAISRLEWFIDAYPHDITTSKEEFLQPFKEALAQPEQEPVAYTNGIDVILAKHWTADYPPEGWKPLGYTTPPPVTELHKRKPLTDEQVLDGFCKAPHTNQFVQAFKAGVRFAEAAHGIKE